MEAIPIAIRQRIIRLYDEGESTSEISEDVGYCPAAVRRVRQHLRERGVLEPQTHRCGRKGHFTPQVQQALREQLRLKPDATLRELRDAMKQNVSLNTISRWSRRLGFTFKKSRCTRPSSSVRT